MIPDVPIREGRPFSAASRAVGVDSVYIAPPSASEETLAQVAEAARGYVYAVSRVGVTGVENEAQTQGLNNAVPTLREHNSTPVLLGFGISKPKHVRAAIVAGADGAITPGVNQPLDELCAQLREFFTSMCAATTKA